MNKKTIAFHHFGCKVNFSEASSISKDFKNKGYDLIDFHEKSDIYVISTCVVTSVAEKKCRAAIRQAHKINPEAKIAVIGCFSELHHDEISKIDGVSLILGNADKFRLLEELEHLDAKDLHDTYHSGVSDLKTFIPSYSSGDRTRSFLKIQDGCDYYCSYCTIPLARGHSRSDTIENVLKNAEAIVAEGIHEIVLTGVNIGDFGRGREEIFFDLVKALDGLPSKMRIRISSIEPDLLSDEIIEFIAKSEKFMPHFHIPLQSGSDTILKGMKRKYTTNLYRSRVEKIKSLLPHACIAADVIVGFPGEQDQEFLETFEFLKSIDISYLHVFSYSRRANTLADKLPNPVQDNVKKKRSELLHQLSDEKKWSFYKQNQGHTSEVLLESDESNGYMHGFTENYIKVKTPFDSSKMNTLKTVTLQDLDTDGCYLV